MKANRVLPKMDTTFEVKGGHDILTAEISGDPKGPTVFLMHGMPGSRIGPKPRASVLYRSGLNLISYDRPGYGGSARQAGRSVADAAADVVAIADWLGIDRFSVVGRSGGAPHALACGALLSDRVCRVAAMASLAPPDAAELDWFKEMVPGNMAGYRAADSTAQVDSIRLKAERILEDPDSLLNALGPELAAADRRVTNNFALRKLLADSYVEALRAGPYGWADDMTALRRDWGFALADISCPVRLWHGLDDGFVPVRHSQWLVRQVRDAELILQENSGHFGTVEALLETLVWAGSDEALRKGRSLKF